MEWSSEEKVKGGCPAAGERWEVKAALMLEDNKVKQSQDKEIREEQSLAIADVEGIQH